MTTRKFSKSSFLLITCWLVYSMSYLGKVNFSASKLPLMEHFGVLEDQVGMVGTFFFFAYGIGMVLNGIFCKKYNIKWTIFLSLMLSSIVNALIPLVPVSAFFVIKYLWLVNGFTLSLLWPCLIRLISETLPREKMPSASKVMGTTVATGTLIIYGLCAIFTELKVFSLSFFVPAIINPIVAIFWLCSFNKFTAKEIIEEIPIESEYKKQEQIKKGKASTQIMLIICCLAIFAVVTNLVKDGLIGWVPKILKDSFALPDSVSILLTVLLPTMGLIASFLTVWLSNKIKSVILIECLFFILASLFVFAITLLLSKDSVVITFILLILTALIASSSNNIITSIFPLYMKGKVNSGLLAGVLNGFCYLGSTISDYGLGAIKVATNSWTSVFYVLLFSCLLVVVISLIYFIASKIKKKN